MLRNKLLAILFVWSLFSAAGTRAQVYEKGSIIADAYIGGPNLFTGVVREAFKLAPEYEVKVSSVLPVGVKFEYVLSKHIGVGLNANYASTSAAGTVTVDEPNSGVSGTFAYKAVVPRTRIMGTFNIHIGSSERLDPYFSFGIGYVSYGFKVKTNAPYYNAVKIPAGFMTGRGEFGLRYFFTDNIGAHMQFGIGGGPLAGGGLSFKF